MKRIFLSLLLAGGLVCSVAAQQTVELNLLHTSDMHSRIEPISPQAADANAGLGGVVRRATLVKHFRAEHLDWICGLKSDEYYVRMAVAWYISVALVKQWDAAIGVLRCGCLDREVHNKAIQKAVESCRISDERKDLLRSLRRR